MLLFLGQRSPTPTTNQSHEEERHHHSTHKTVLHVNHTRRSSTQPTINVSATVSAPRPVRTRRGGRTTPFGEGGSWSSQHQRTDFSLRYLAWGRQSIQRSQVTTGMWQQNRATRSAHIIPAESLVISTKKIVYEPRKPVSVYSGSIPDPMYHPFQVSVERDVAVLDPFFCEIARIHLTNTT